MSRPNDELTCGCDAMPVSGNIEVNIGQGKSFYDTRS